MSVQASGDGEQGLARAVRDIAGLGLVLLLMTVIPAYLALWMCKSFLYVEGIAGFYLP